jgi:hypothetical protein
MSIIDIEHKKRGIKKIPPLFKIVKKTSPYNSYPSLTPSYQNASLLYT